MQPSVLILHAPGTNRDREAALACKLAGGRAHIVHLNRLLSGETRLLDHQMLVLPGGFSFGDDLGAGKLWATLLRARFGDDLQEFVAAGKPVLGICNGFQALVKTGLLPGLKPDAVSTGHQSVTLTRNRSARFECRWVWLEADPASPCVFTRSIEERILCPVAHGEGRLVIGDSRTQEAISTGHLGALRYTTSSGGEADYPADPNGSDGHLAGLTNPAGNVLGLMPHPEDHVVAHQHPRWHRGEHGNLGLALFRNGVRHAAEL